jgi:hypothetical protein
MMMQMRQMKKMKKDRCLLRDQMHSLIKHHIQYATAMSFFFYVLDLKFDDDQH